MAYGCEILFDAQTAERVSTEVQRQLGGACPCMEGRACPLLPASYGPPASASAPERIELSAPAVPYRAGV